MEMLQSAEFWIGLVKIIWINIILSGDNAVVIALAARSLPPEQQRKAVFFGSGAAVVLRIALTVVAAKLLEMSYLQIIGGLLLLWIGVQLLGDEEDGDGEAKHSGGMMAAVRTILIADLVMSLDNVIAVAAAAKGSMVLLVLGLVISIPRCFWQHPDDQTDVALSRHRHFRRGAHRLGWRRNDCQRRRAQAFPCGPDLGALRCGRGRSGIGGRAGQVDAPAPRGLIAAREAGNLGPARMPCGALPRPAHVLYRSVALAVACRLAIGKKTTSWDEQVPCRPQQCLLTYLPRIAI